MNIKLERSYRSAAKGNVVFVYSVTGTEKELAAFKAAQGEYYRDDESGKPLWFTTKCVGQRGTLIITTTGKVVPDMSAFDQAASLASQYGGNFGQELAKAAASLLTGKAPTQASVPDEVPEPSGDITV